MKIRKKIIQSIVRKAKEELPNEACGYLLGKNEEIFYHFPMTNIDQSPEHFSFKPEEQFSAVRYARQEELEIIANWHSHPSTPSRPSEEDIRLAYDPDTLYFILSLVTEPPVLNGFRIREGIVEKIKLDIIE